MLLTNRNGYIRLYRSILEWEWYDEPNTYRLFTHLLYTVNWKDNRWHGYEVKRGQRIASYDTLAKELKLSIQNIRTALSNLQKSGEVTVKSTNKFTLITVENYEKFQGDDPEDNKQVTNNQQTTNKQVTNNQQTGNKQLTTNEERKESKKEKEGKKVSNVAFFNKETGEVITEEEADAHIDRLMKGLKK